MRDAVASRNPSAGGRCKVYINTAPTEEITTTLGLSNKDADAIVAYRKANGNFRDFEAVKKVPDIDVKILEDHKDAVAF